MIKIFTTKEAPLIRNQWYVILESNEIKQGKLTGVTRMAEKLVAWRDGQGKATVMADRCPHRGVALSMGEIKSDCVQCPFHGFEFDTSGSCTLIPANGKNAAPPRAMKVKTYPTRESHGLVYIWWGHERETYPPLPYFNTLDERFVFATLRDHWHAHYSRAIENQLDVVHLPFVHRTTIGAGNRTIVNGPQYTLTETSSGSLLEVWVNNEMDNGQTPKKPAEMPQPTRHAQLQFQFPNLWHNWIGDNIRVFIAFAPIDHENTMMYLRYYHTVKLPILRQITGWLGSLGNLFIERQDKWVVVTEQPKRPDLDIGEVLIQGDGPVIGYRKTRRALIDAKETGGELPDA